MQVHTEVDVDEDAELVINVEINKTSKSNQLPRCSLHLNFQRRIEENRHSELEEQLHGILVLTIHSLNLLVYS